MAKETPVGPGIVRLGRHANDAELLDTKPSIMTSPSPLMATTVRHPTRTRGKVLEGREADRAVEGLRMIKMQRAIAESLQLEETMEEMAPETRAVEAEIQNDASRLLLVMEAQKVQGPRRTIAFNALWA